MPSTVFQCQFCKCVYTTIEGATECEEQHRAVKEVISKHFDGRLLWLAPRGCTLSQRIGDGYTVPSLSETFIRGLRVVVQVDVEVEERAATTSTVKFTLVNPLGGKQDKSSFQFRFANKEVFTIIKKPMTQGWDGATAYLLAQDVLGMDLFISDVEVLLKLLHGEKMPLSLSAPSRRGKKR